MSLHDAARRQRAEEIRHCKACSASMDICSNGDHKILKEQAAAAAFADWCLHQATPTIHRDSLQRKDHGHSRS